MVLPYPAVMIQITKNIRREMPDTTCPGRADEIALPKNNLRNTQKRGIIMMMRKKLQKVLAIALMTSFFSTSFVMGVSEAAPARQAGGQRPAQSQQVRPMQKSTGHHARPTHQGAPRQQSRPMQRNTPNHQGPAMHRNTPGHQGPVMHKNSPRQQGPAVHKNGPGHQGPVMHKNSPRQQGPAMHKNGPGHQGPAMHKNGPGHQGPVMHKGQPMSHKSGSIHHGPTTHKGRPTHHGNPMMHKGGPAHGGPAVHHPAPHHNPGPEYHYPAPPPPPDYRDDHRSMHTEDWLGALIVGGLLGAIIANAGHHSGNYYAADY